jgi:hypothetical protein
VKKFLLNSSVLALSIQLLHAAEPSAKYNLNGQARTRSCTPMDGEKVPLRFADGTPTGFFVRADDPSRQGGNKPCPIGSMEVDAHEIITTGTGMELFFHPGGGGSHYQNPVENGQYGHIAASDQKLRPTLKPTPNGRPAPLTKSGSSTGGYFIMPTRIPKDMYYKPNVNHGHSGSTYYTYGNPGYDKTGGRGDWTYINWSWVQNGGSHYPENICRGGGMVRALGKRGEVFTACDVEPIIGYAYGTNNQINGRVTAVYGKTTAGNGGGAIYGWLPHSYQKNGEIIVPCLRRRDAGPPSAESHKAARLPFQIDACLWPDPPHTPDRMERMAMNLCSCFRLEPSAANKLRSDWVKRFQGEHDAQARMELITEISRLDEPQTVGQLLKLLANEKDARAREQIIVIIGFMGAAQTEMKSVGTALLENFSRSNDEREKLRTLEIVSNIPGAESLAFLEAVKKLPIRR